MGFPDRSSQMEIDASSRSRVIDQRKRPSNVYEEWIENSIRDGLIHCYSEGDIKVGRTPIVFKATMKRTGMPVAMKTLVRRSGESDEKLYKKFVKEVRLISSFAFTPLHACYQFLTIIYGWVCIAEKPQESEWSPEYHPISRCL